MNIALDGTPLSCPTGGIRRYTEQLASAIATEFPADSVRLFSDQPIDSAECAAANVLVEGGPRTGWADRRWWSLGLPRALRRHDVDVFHGTDFAVPYLKLVPSVLTIHDLSPWRNPAWHDSAGRVKRRTPALLRFSLATLVITPTAAIGREVIERFRISPSIVVRVYEAASPVFWPREVHPGRQYLLYAGTLEPRKNVDAVVNTWRHVREDRDVQLVLAGRMRSDFKRPPEEAGLEYTGAVSDERLAELYSGAAAVLYPSHYEGFGLPVLEAMQCGAPVITSSDPAICEVSGDGALHIDPDDTASFARAIRSVLDNPECAGSLRARALKRAAQFSWARAARETREVYLEAIRRFRG